MRPSLSLVVPVFNEQDRFAEHADELADFVRSYGPGSELLVVDDGSADATVEVVEKVMANQADQVVRLLRRPHQGKGAAVRAGLNTAVGEYAAFCDVDLSTPLTELEQVIAAARMCRVLAIGSRDAAGSHLVRPQRPLREALGRSYNRLVQLTLAPGLIDTQCGAKAAAADVWAAILPFSREPHLAWDVEMVALAARLGIQVQEVAVRWTDDERSRIRLGRDGLAMVAALARIAATVRRVPAHARVAATAAAGSGPGPSGPFDRRQAATLLESDGEHWWFRSKAAFVADAIRRHVPAVARGQGRLVDVGAGAGGVTARLGWPPVRLVAVEGAEALAAEAGRRHALHAVAGTGERLPLADGSASIVCLLDVLEHLDDTAATLREAWRVLSPGGHLVVTVPAHAWLWSEADELLGHVRRYTRPLLRAHLAEAGFTPVQLTHVFSWLLAPVWAARRLAALCGRGGQAQLGLDRTSPLVAAAAFVLTRAELRLVGAWRLSLPAGTSILCVAGKASGGDRG